MFALCRFLMVHPPEQCEPQAPSAIDGASALHRESLHRHRRYHMGSIAVLVLVATGMLWCGAAFAQERLAKGNMSKERELASVRALEKPPQKDARVEVLLKNDRVSIEIQTADVLQSLLENRGRIPLFSGMNGKVQLELGLFGYLGLKYQF